MSCAEDSPLQNVKRAQRREDNEQTRPGPALPRITGMGEWGLIPPSTATSHDPAGRPWRESSRGPWSWVGEGPWLSGLQHLWWISISSDQNWTLFNKISWCYINSVLTRIKLFGLRGNIKSAEFLVKGKKENPEYFSQGQWIMPSLLCPTDKITQSACSVLINPANNFPAGFPCS